MVVFSRLSPQVNYFVQFDILYMNPNLSVDFQVPLRLKEAKKEVSENQEQFFLWIFIFFYL